MLQYYFSSNKNGLIILDEDNSNHSSYIYNNFSEEMSAHLIYTWNSIKQIIGMVLISKLIFIMLWIPILTFNNHHL